MKGALTEKLLQKEGDGAAGTVEKYIEIVERKRSGGQNVYELDEEEEEYKFMMDDWTILDEEEDCKLMMDLLQYWGGSVSAMAGTKYVECFWNMHCE